MKCDRVVVDVLVATFDSVPRVTVVGGSHQIIVGLVKYSKAMRVSPQLLIIVGAGTARDKIVRLSPADTCVFTTPKAAFSIRQLDRCVDMV